MKIEPKEQPQERKNRTMHEELLLKTQVPEVLCRYGARYEAREMIKAHNEMILRKAGAFDSGRPTGEIRTVKDGERIARNRQERLLSSFEDKEYRATAKRFLEKVLPGMQRDIARYDAEVKDATARYNEAVAKCKEAHDALENSRNKRNNYCKELGETVIKPFLYVNDGAGILPRCGHIPQKLYPQLGFAVPSYNFDPAEHVKYMLQDIERRDAHKNE